MVNFPDILHPQKFTFYCWNGTFQRPATFPVAQPTGSLKDVCHFLEHYITTLKQAPNTDNVTNVQPHPCQLT